MKKTIIFSLILIITLFDSSVIKATNKVYVTNFGSDFISVIDADNLQKIADIKTGQKPHGINVSPNGAYVFVSDEGDNNVVVIDPSTDKVIKIIPVGESPNMLAITNDSKLIYVTINKESRVDVIDVETMSVVKQIPVGKNPHMIEKTLDGKNMIVTSEGEMKISIINTEEQKISKDINIFGFPRIFTLSPDGKFLYLTVRWINGCVIIDMQNYVVNGIIELNQTKNFPSEGKSAHGLRVLNALNEIWITSQILNSVSIIDLGTLDIKKEISVGKDPNWIDFSSDNKYAFVSNTGSNDVSVIDITSSSLIKNIPVGNNPKRLVSVSYNK